MTFSDISDYMLDCTVGSKTSIVSLLIYLNYYSESQFLIMFLIKDIKCNIFDIFLRL